MKVNLCSGSSAIDPSLVEQNHWYVILAGSAIETQLTRYYRTGTGLNRIRADAPPSVEPMA